MSAASRLNASHEVPGAARLRWSRASRTRLMLRRLSLVSKRSKSLRYDTFPFEAVRDLLGILRAMYAAAAHDGAGAVELDRLRGLGAELRAAIDLAIEHEPGTLGFTAAWERAERAVRGVVDAVDVTTPLEPTVEAAGRRISGGIRDGRAAARRARQGRG